MSKAAELAALISSQSALSHRNFIINGAMQVAQRGTSSTGLGADQEDYHVIDRIKHLSGGTSAGRYTVTQESITDLEGFPKALKLACTTADTSIGAGEFLGLSYFFEGQDVQGLEKGFSTAKPVTVSFYVKGNASATYTAELKDSDNSRTNGQTFSVTTDWTRVKLTYPGDTTGKLNNDNGLSFALSLFLHGGSTYTGGTFTNGTWASEVAANRISSSNSSFYDSTSRTFFITGLQIELGEQATPFEHRSFADELRRCQRYAYKIGGSRSDTYGPGMGLYQDGNEFNFGPVFPPVTFRANPSLTVFGTAPAIKINGGANTGFTATISCAANEMQFIRLTKSSHGLSASHVANMNFASTSDYIILDAEL